MIPQWWILTKPKFDTSGIVYVHDEPGYRGLDDLIGDWLYKWKQGRRNPPRPQKEI